MFVLTGPLFLLTGPLTLSFVCVFLHIDLSFAKKTLPSVVARFAISCYSCRANVFKSLGVWSYCVLVACVPLSPRPQAGRRDCVQGRRSGRQQQHSIDDSQ